jgi:hypothetical protein
MLNDFGRIFGIVDLDGSVGMKDEETGQKLALTLFAQLY